MNRPHVQAGWTQPQIDAEPGRLPPELEQALRANERLGQALVESGLPTRFGAMVLGLATLRQLGEERR